MDSPIFSYCRDLNGFYTPEAWHELRRMLGRLSFEVKLMRNGSSTKVP